MTMSCVPGRQIVLSMCKKMVRENSLGARVDDFKF